MTQDICYITYIINYTKVTLLTICVGNFLILSGNKPIRKSIFSVVRFNISTKFTCYTTPKRRNLIRSLEHRGFA